MTKGLIYIITGDGKGKTTASFGLALRAAGNGWKTLVIQFLKDGSWKSGEVEYIAKHIPEIDVISCGGGFVGIAHDNKSKSHHINKAEEAFKIMADKLKKGDYQLLILDEINVAIDLKLIELSHVTQFLKTKPKNLHVVLTGRNAHPTIIKLANMVSEIKNIKHPFNNGQTAQKGIDY
ncbi:MAG: hypothetical protein ACD_58C00285G0002 [uncultured bacterium]|nr:MAG: hypothetical protein ACD_58C00285G0002 [uncultured bacterium]